MKFELTRKETVDVKTCLICAEVRYWEDAILNGEEDSEGRIPFRQGETWNPEIDIEAGKILNWPAGVTADVHYKVCDAGSYFLKDADGNIVAKIENDYVPNKLIPGDYGDYIVMKINGEGAITNWPSRPSLEDFGDDER